MKRNGYQLVAPWAPWFFLAPFLFSIGLFLVVPLGKSVVLAFQQTFGPQTRTWVGFTNFHFLLTDPLFWKALRNTFTYAAASIFLQLPLSLGLALLLNRPGLKGRAFFRLIFFSPSLVGLVFVGLMFSLMFQKRTGLINTVIHALVPAFNPEFAWLETFVMPALIIAALWLYVGFNMVYFLAALQNVPRELLEAAEIDGAGAWQRFRHVVLPEIMPIASFVTLLSALGSLQLFELPFVLLQGSGPDNAGLTVVMYLYNTGFVTGDLGYASAIGWILALIMLSLGMFQRWFMKRNEA